MAEYIEREAVLKLLNRNSITKHITFADDVSIYDTIKNMISADVVEVVRCKKCKHRTEVTECNNTLYFCRKKQNYIKLTDYCSYGERKDG